MPEFLVWSDIVSHFGGRAQAEEALCRAAILGDKPPIPWDWEELIANYYDRQCGLIWSMERLTAALSKRT